ncbi:MAG: hypothetical protein H0W72_00960 [Planctomycetes bacterium]|nr:hypothetical protein [Planctomycetota bacterium]
MRPAALRSLNPLEHADAALVALGRLLERSGYHFVPPSAETHRRVCKRPRADRAHDLRDVFGWNLPFAPGLLSGEMTTALDEAGMLERRGGLLASGVRVASVAGRLAYHGAASGGGPEDVTIVPDAYRCLRFARDQAAPWGRLLALNCGAGVVPLALADRATVVILADPRATALRLCRVNAALAGVAKVEIVTGDGPRSPAADTVLIDLAWAGDAGSAIAAALLAARAALGRIGQSGRILIHAPAPILAGEDRLRSALSALADEAGARLAYDELETDILGEEIAMAGELDRIAAVGAVLTRG